MKKNGVVLAVFVLMGVLFSNVVNAEESNFSFSGKAAVESEYVGGYTGLNCLDEPIAKFDFGASHDPSGIFTNVEIISAFKEQSDGRTLQFGEIDLGIKRSFNDWTFLLVSSWFDCGKVFRSGAKDDFYGFWAEIYTPEIKLGEFFLGPYFCMERDFPFKEEISGEGGLYWKYGANLRLDGIDFVSVNIAFGGHEGIFGFEPDFFSFGRLTLTGKIPIKGRLIFSPEISFQRRLH